MFLREKYFVEIAVIALGRMADVLHRIDDAAENVAVLVEQNLTPDIVVFG